MTNDKVTIKDIYEVVNRLEDKMDRNFAQQSTRMDTQDTRIDDMEKKVSNMEGRSAVMSIIFSGAVTAIMYNIKAFFGK